MVATYDDSLGIIELFPQIKQVIAIVVAKSNNLKSYEAPDRLTDYKRIRFCQHDLDAAHVQHAKQDTMPCGMFFKVTCQAFVVLRVPIECRNVAWIALSRLVSSHLSLTIKREGTVHGLQLHSRG
jgi:hypothetical protein